MIFPSGLQLIAAMQNGMAIFSYIKYWKLTGRNDSSILDRAMLIGDYLCENSLTDESFVYGGVPRSSGIGIDFPLITAAQRDVDYGVNTV